ncbi:FecR family protein [Pseudodesulfovibrio sediminis]|uniref:FecR protein domain-containing protein n=1 Tax=Pseudodesulfovibrio sediminis TaxID=2810563 RepID=A0ABM7P8W9_9BACT|nr:FecR family protein [Pseudodesulfovibrio sediminis]BCS89484.1 hypothetical protein PSDVSF_27260 [Pseudodesulfovibrio sediminis]
MLVKQHMITALVIFALMLLVLPAYANDQIGVVQTAEGECRVHRGDSILKAVEDLPIVLNDTVSTGSDAQIRIVFNDDTELIIAESSQASIDTYVYSDDAADVLFEFTKGTFRTITGEIVKNNPDGFNIQTPLTTIGIRGSDIYAIIQSGGEETGALHLGENHTLEIKTAKQTLSIKSSGLRAQIFPTGVIVGPTPIPEDRSKAMLKLGARSTSSPNTPPVIKTPTTTPNQVVKPPTVKQRPRFDNF